MLARRQLDLGDWGWATRERLMPTLANAKHERYAQGVAKGLSQTQAYTEAGYIGDETAASRLSRNVKVQARVTELLAGASIRAEISVASVTTDLLRLAAKAEALGDAAGIQASRACIVDAAKVNGLVVEKVQADVTNRDVKAEELDDDALAHIAGRGRVGAAKAPGRSNGSDPLH